jgi:hypothetical protein
MNRHAKSEGFPTRLFILLLFNANLLMVALVWLQLFGQKPLPPVIEVAPCAHSQQPAISPEIHMDVQGISVALDSICRSMETLSTDVARINVTGIQYAYLTRETERLERASELVTMRIQSLESEARTKGRPSSVSGDIVKLREMRDKLNKETGQRNQLLIQLVQKLEDRFPSNKSKNTAAGPTAPSAASPGIPSAEPSGSSGEKTWRGPPVDAKPTK